MFHMKQNFKNGVKNGAGLWFVYIFGRGFCSGNYCIFILRIQKVSAKMQSKMFGKSKKRESKSRESKIHEFRFATKGAKC